VVYVCVSMCLVCLDVVVTRKEADFARAIDGNPPLLSRTIYTRALVKTGETVVLGGLMREDTTETVQKVPWFSDLPFLGWFFRRTQERDDTSQLMIFLTPSILPTPLTKSGVIKTAKPLKTSSLLPQKSKAKSEGRGQEAVGSKQEEQQGVIEAQTDQQSAISGQSSAKQNTERQEAVGSEQSAGLQDQEAKSEKQQKDYGPDITRPLSPVRTDLGTPLAADRIW